MDDRVHFVAVIGLIALSLVALLGLIILPAFGKPVPEIIAGGAIVTLGMGYVGGLFSPMPTLRPPAARQGPSSTGIEVNETNTTPQSGEKGTNGHES